MKQTLRTGLNWLTALVRHYRHILKGKPDFEHLGHRDFPAASFLILFLLAGYARWWGFLNYDFLQATFTLMFWTGVILIAAERKNRSSSLSRIYFGISALADVLFIALSLIGDEFKSLPLLILGMELVLMFFARTHFLSMPSKVHARVSRENT